MNLASSLTQAIHRLHYTRPTPLWWWMLMILPTIVYRMGVALRQWSYQVRLKKNVYLPVPVISVGNLTTGGTGKTPMTVAIAHYLHHELKLNVGILSRGYGATEPQTYARAENPDYGDEAFMIQNACPFATVIVGRKRCENALRLIKESPIEVLVLDDGFQYLPLARDLNVLLVDETARLGNGHILPLGPLREPLASLRRADSLLMTRSCNASSLDYLNALIRKSKARKTHPDLVAQHLTGVTPLLDSTRTEALDYLKARKALLFTGIGNPQQFMDGVKATEVTLLATLILADHEALEGYALEQLQHLWRKFEKPMILCTHKDAVKLNLQALGDLAESIHIVEFELLLPEGFKQLIKRFVGLGERQGPVQLETPLPSSSLNAPALTPAVGPAMGE
jgi:tetraacyldisaccharide 4'-kinase